MKCKSFADRLISFEINWDERINFENVGIIWEQIYYHCHNSSKDIFLSNIHDILDSTDDKEGMEDDDKDEEENDKRNSKGALPLL